MSTKKKAAATVRRKAYRVILNGDERRLLLNALRAYKSIQQHLGPGGPAREGLIQELSDRVKDAPEAK